MDLDPSPPPEPELTHDLLKRPFRQLFTRDEVLLYGYGALVYVVLGVFVTDIILNWIIGPLFIIVWVWWVPPYVDRWRARRAARRSGQ